MHSTSSREKRPSGVMPLWPMPSSSWKRSKTIVGAAQHATDIGADLDVVSAGGLEAQHGVVGGHVADFEFGDADALRDFGDHRVGEIADLVLRIEQHGNQRRAPHRIFLDQRVEAGGQLRRKDGHGLITHCINSRAHFSAAISISSSRPLALPDRNCPGFSQLKLSASSIFALPVHHRPIAPQVQPIFPVPDRDPFLAQLDCCLSVPVQPMRRGVAAEQGSQRNPKLA